MIEVLATAAILGSLAIFTQHNQSYAVATFSEIWKTFDHVFLFDQFTEQVLPTLRRILIGFTAATVAGFLTGAALGSSRLVRAICDPALAFVRSIPPVALVPPFILLIGIGDNMKIAIVVFVGMWPVALNTADGLLEVDRTMLDMARSVRLSALERWRFVMLPAVLPRTLAGMQTALSISVIAVIATEYLVGTEGLGFLLSQSQQSVAVPTMWATIVMIGVVGFLLNTAFDVGRRRLLFWVPSATR